MDSSILKLKTLGIVILIILGLLASYLIFKPDHVVDNPKIPVTLDTVTVKTDKKGNQYSEVKEHLYSQKEVNKMYDSLKKVYSVAKIKYVDRFVTSIDTHFVTNTLYLDTNEHVVFDYKLDSYMYVEYLGNLDTHYGTFTVKFRPDSQAVISTFKSHIFKKNEDDIITTHSNPYFKPVSGSAVNTSYSTPVLILGPSLTLPLTDIKHPTIGISITWNLISLINKH